VNRAVGSWPSFSSFSLKIWNTIQHESCVLQKTGQLSYWEILKCLGEIWRTWQKFRRTFKDIRVSMGLQCCAAAECAVAEPQRLMCLPPPGICLQHPSHPGPLRRCLPLPLCHLGCSTLGAWLRRGAEQPTGPRSTCCRCWPCGGPCSSALGLGDQRKRSSCNYVAQWPMLQNTGETYDEWFGSELLCILQVMKVVPMEYLIRARFIWN
jgi:hypothetical protein